MQLQLHYITQHCATLITLHCNCNYHYIALHDTTLQLQLQYFTLQYTRLHYTIPRYCTQHYSTLQYTTLITPHHNYNCNCNYTTLITLHYNYNLKLQLRYTTATTTPTTTYTTALHLQLQLQLRYTTTSSSCGEVTTATIAATPQNTPPTTCRPISGFALPSVIHNNQSLL